MDSGGASGRHWQQPAIDEKSPTHYIKVWGDDNYMPMISLAAMFDDLATIDQQATRHFQLWAAMADPSDRESWLALMETYCERMIETGRWSNSEDRANPMTDNSYNWETDFDQDFQFTAPGLYSDRLLVQFHNGADVRGGYTAPVVVDFGQFGFEELLCMDRFSLYCNDCYAEAEDTYRAEEDGWKFTHTDDTVTVLCPDGHDAAEYPRT
tara:strand:- start:82 stop:711 length:630 start_codon:yes stop_codon:yes gene_type:complete